MKHMKILSITVSILSQKLLNKGIYCIIRSMRGDCLKKKSFDILALSEYIAIGFCFLQGIFYLYNWDMDLRKQVILIIPAMLVILIMEESNLNKVVIIGFPLGFILAKIFLKLEVLDIILLGFGTAVGIFFSILLRKDIGKLKRLILTSAILLTAFLIVLFVSGEEKIKNPNLRKLFESRVKYRGAEVTLLRDISVGDDGGAGYYEIKNIKGIDVFSNLKRVNIFGELTDVEDIFKLHKIEQINMTHENSVILKNISRFDNLKEINLNGINLDYDLPKCDKLENIEIGLIKADNLKKFTQLKEIKVLWLVGVELNSLDGISEFSKLEKIYMDNVKVINMDDLLLNDSVKKIILFNTNIKIYEDKIREKGIEITE